VPKADDKLKGQPITIGNGMQQITSMHAWHHHRTDGKITVDVLAHFVALCCIFTPNEIQLAYIF